MTKKIEKSVSSAAAQPAAKGRGRPRKFDTEKVLDRAQHLFHAQGYDRVGIAQLTAEFGMKPPSLYAAFGNKRGLFDAVVERYSAREGQFIAKAIESSSSVREGLRGILISGAEIYSRNRETAGCMVLEGAHRNYENGASDICFEKRCETESHIADFVATEYPDKSKRVANLTMIALAGLSASARTGLSPEALLDFANLSADGLEAFLETKLNQTYRSSGTP
ncbi:TetR/AcrR family transcriptional regulator [Parasphingorhabdus litoris]|uniref:TetR/AcrR family transcriptional regulator n=1 Tax=Parasphingorhabdus litoris TaxID=394733 RepID=A0ABN1B2I7_9SPHN|nr:TetR/AcrR family transcriptional regulator [Parasphingorhabdus litoris]